MKYTNNREVNERVEDNRENLRQLFVEYLINECDYSRTVAENSDDWREERLDTELLIKFPHHYPKTTNLPFIWLYFQNNENNYQRIN